VIVTNEDESFDQTPSQENHKSIGLSKFMKKEQEDELLSTMEVPGLKENRVSIENALKLGNK
jgi:hypothetical protein